MDESIIPYGKPFVDQDDIQAVVQVLKSDSLTQGQSGKVFEKALAEYCRSKFAVTFSSGTASLHAVYSCCGLDFGDQVIMSPMTFVATANALLYVGAEPVFVDIERDTGNIDPNLIEKSITSRTKAIVVVDYAGHPVDLSQIFEIAQKYDLLVIEDGCCGLGGEYMGKRIGSLSDLTIFSFHAVKNITTGEGGAVLTDHKEFYEKLCLFRSHGIIKNHQKSQVEGDWVQQMEILGYNYRISDIQSALGNSQLKKLDHFITKRRKIAQYYDQEFQSNPYFDCPIEKSYAKSSYHLYSIRLKDSCLSQKKEIFAKLRKLGLWVQVHYVPVYRHPYYEKLGYHQKDFPKTEDFYRREISLPLYPKMTDQDVSRCIDVIWKVFKSF